MIFAMLLAQFADLLSFLVAIIAFPDLIDAEVGFIKDFYTAFGVIGAVAWKGGLAVAVYWALTQSYKEHPRKASAVAAVGFVFGMVGTVFNTVAFWSRLVAG